jgi:thioredoxin reductase (NADPH)
MSAYLIDRIRAAPNVEVLASCEVTGLDGDDLLQEITIKDAESGIERKAKTHWLFVCIGGVPQTSWAADAGIARDDKGYLVTGPDLGEDGRRPPHWPLDREPYYLETNVPGVFAAGDVRHGSVKRCASAVGEGAMAVAFVHRHLASN